MRCDFFHCGRSPLTHVHWQAWEVSDSLCLLDRGQPTATWSQNGAHNAQRRSMLLRHVHERKTPHNNNYASFLFWSTPFRRMKVFESWLPITFCSGSSFGLATTRKIKNQVHRAFTSPCPHSSCRLLLLLLLFFCYCSALTSTFLAGDRKGRKARSCWTCRYRLHSGKLDVVKVHVTSDPLQILPFSLLWR